jgi:hypothetical protein
MSSSCRRHLHQLSLPQTPWYILETSAHRLLESIDNIYQMDGIMLGDFGSAIHYTKSLVQPDGDMKWSEVKWSELLRQKKDRKSGHKWGKPLFKHVQTSHTTPHPLLTNRARLQRIWSLDPGHQHRLPNFISCSGVLVMIQQISTIPPDPVTSHNDTNIYKLFHAGWASAGLSASVTARRTLLLGRNLRNIEKLHCETVMRFFSCC